MAWATTMAQATIVPCAIALQLIRQLVDCSVGPGPGS